MGNDHEAPASNETAIDITFSRDECVESMTHTYTEDENQLVTIPRVPKRLRLGEDDAYEPRIISFGPYHHGKAHLQAMEEHKERYVNAILSRSTRLTPSREGLTNIIQNIMEYRARKCYSEEFQSEGEDFFKMMLRDGCFIVEYLLRIQQGTMDELNNMIWVTPLVLYDILLLENQLPFIVLECLFKFATVDHPELCCHSFTETCIDYFNRIFNKNVSFPPPKPVHHLLHLCHLFRVHASSNSVASDDVNSLAKKEKGKTANTSSEANKDKAVMIYDPSNGSDGEPIVIPSATRLQELGIKLKKNEEKGCSILDIKFTKGVLEIPSLVIDSFTKSQFRNLIAFEQFHPRSKDGFLTNFSAYVEFMDYIVNSPEDVALLNEEGILKHFLGCDEDVANLFNNLNRGTFVDRQHYLSPLYKKVDKYRNLHWPKWRATLKHNYFNTPWAALSVIAAVVLLILTLVQTFFSVYAAF